MSPCHILRSKRGPPTDRKRTKICLPIFPSSGYRKSIPFNLIRLSTKAREMKFRSTFETQMRWYVPCTTVSYITNLSCITQCLFEYASPCLHYQERRPFCPCRSLPDNVMDRGPARGALGHSYPQGELTTVFLVLILCLALVSDYRVGQVRQLRLCRQEPVRVSLFLA